MLEEIINEINNILAATHGRARKELRKKISNNCAIRELAVEAGKIGKPLANILEKTRNIFDMDILRINDDEVLTDMEAIHKYLTEFYEKWFQAKKATRKVCTQMMLTGSGSSATGNTMTPSRRRTTLTKNCKTSSGRPFRVLKHR